MLYSWIWLLVRPGRLGWVVVLFVALLQGETVYRLVAWQSVDARVSTIETVCQVTTETLDGKERRTETVTASCDLVPKLKMLAAAKGASIRETKVHLVTFTYSPPGGSIRADQMISPLSAPLLAVGSVLPRLVDPSDATRSASVPDAREMVTFASVFMLGVLLIFSSPIFRWARSFWLSEEEAEAKRFVDDFMRRRPLWQKLVMALRAPVYGLFGLSVLLSGLAAVVTGGLAFLPEAGIKGILTPAHVKAVHRDCEVKRTLYADVEERHVIASCANALPITEAARLAHWTVAERATLTVSYEFQGLRRSGEVVTSGTHLFTGGIGDAVQAYVGGDGRVVGIDGRDVHYRHFLWALGLFSLSLATIWLTGQAEKRALADLREKAIDLADATLRELPDEFRSKSFHNETANGLSPVALQSSVRQTANGRPVVEFGRRRSS